MKEETIMKTEIKIYDGGLDEYPKRIVVTSNFLMILWITLGIAACWFLFPLAGWVYFSLAIITVFIVLQKTVCSNCYYYNKWCNTGWGKLCALLFKKGDIEKFNTSSLKIAPPIYSLLTLLPLILILDSIIQQFTMFKIAVLIPLLLISFYSGTISRKKACISCKMRLICPGSAIR